MSGRRRAWPPAAHALHLAALWSLAVAQPLLDLLGRNAEFFAIRRSEAVDIVVFAVGLVVVPPLVLLGVEALLGRLDARLMRAAHLAFVAALVALIAVVVLKRVSGSTAVLAPLALLVGGGAAVLYEREAAVRTFLSALAVAPVIIVGLFLFGTPVHRLLSTGGEPAALAADGGRAPVVLLVLDELPITSLLRADGSIDERRYPNFAALARDSLWFRNTSTVDGATEHAVPAILTGRLPQADALPTAADHPQNVFTLLGRGRRLHVHEAVSDLCPEQLCHEPGDAPSFVSRMRSLASDLEVVGAHVLLPDDLRDRLPSIDQRWQDFRGQPRDEGTASGKQRAGEEFAQALGRDLTDRPGLFDAFVDGIPQPRPGAPGPLNVLHVLLPHIPWEYMPDGRRYRGGDDNPGLHDETWSSDPGAAQAGFERHLLAAGYVDRLLGRLVRRLRKDGSYDETLLVVTADHGVSFRPGGPRRHIERANAQDIFPVPLFVKPPGRPHGRVIDTPIQTIDILPTMAQILGVRVPWRIEGVSALSARAGRRTVSATNAGRDPVSIGTARLDRLRRAALRRQVALLGEGGPPRLRHGGASELVGRRVGATAAARDGASATVDDPADFVGVDRDAPTLPLLVAGSVRGVGGTVTIAVNGRIGAVAPVFRDQGPLRFAAIVPPSLLRDGTNRVDVLAVRGGRMVRLGGTGGRKSLYTLAGESIVAPGGRRYRIVKDRLVGAIDKTVRDGDVVHLSGWAAQAGSWRPVEQVVGFRAGRQLFAGAPWAERPDLKRARLGFTFHVVEPRASGRPQVFALHDGVAGVLGWYCGSDARQDVGC